MTFNLHYHFTGPELVWVVILEIAWLGAVFLGGRAWFRHRKLKKDRWP